jgi:dTDP-4-amino-4,6-dideoxygalactose transaminase
MPFPVFKPFLGSEELAACSQALECKFLGMGSFVGSFEEKLSEVLELNEDRQLVTFSTGHAAMHLGLLALGIGPGDEVITPSFNNVADFQAIEATGAVPVFCDIDDRTLCINPSAISELITPATKAIVAMDYGACLANHEAIGTIAAEFGVHLFHDAAHSFGSRYFGKPIGHQSSVTMLSFDPIKNITCIDGGALVVNDLSLVTPLREMRLIGMSQKIERSYSNKRDWGYDVHRMGFRYHLANLHAAVGLAQLNKFPDIQVRRRRLYQAYLERLEQIPRLVTQGPLGDDIVPFIMCVRVPGQLRRAFKQFLLSNDIETGIHWTPGHLFSRYRNHRSGPLEVTDRIAGEIVSLPFYPDLTLEDVDYICSKINEFFDND